MPRGYNDYGYQHQQERKRLGPIVATGRVVCPRCKKPIHPGAPWDLGHHDVDRSVYVGPEHRKCNRGAPRRRRTSEEW